MRRLIVFALVIATTMMVVPAPVLAADAAANGTIAGVAIAGDQRPAGNMMVRPRNIDTTQIAGGGVTNVRGEFILANLAPGRYVVEAVNASGKMIGSSPIVAVTAGASTTANLTVRQSGHSDMAPAKRSFMKSGGWLLVAAGVSGTAAAYVALRNPGKVCTQAQ